MGDGDEYMEQKIRVYQPKKVKEENKFSKYFVKPITKAMSGKKSDKQRRVSA